MKKNVSPIDKGIRIATALIIAALYTLGAIGGGLAVFLGIIALVLIVTSALTFCPVYSLFNISTRSEPTA